MCLSSSTLHDANDQLGEPIWLKISYFTNTVRWKKCLQSDLFWHVMDNWECWHKRNGGKLLAENFWWVPVLCPCLADPAHNEMGWAGAAKVGRDDPKYFDLQGQNKNFRSGVKGKENIRKKRSFKRKHTPFPCLLDFRVCFCLFPGVKYRKSYRTFVDNNWL